MGKKIFAKIEQTFVVGQKMNSTLEVPSLYNLHYYIKTQRILLKERHWAVSKIVNFCSPLFRTDLAGTETDRAIEEYAARRRFQTRQEIQK
jgi:hypothetical protein